MNRFPDVVRKQRGIELDQVRWSTRIEFPGVMDIIDIDEVLATLDRLLATPVEQRLAPSVALAVLAVWQGARIVRVHDVAATVQAVRMCAAVRAAE
mgnify:CR=1 FL=1